MADLGETFRKMFLASVGAAAVTGEKAQEVIDDLVARGEITVDQGLEFNKELKHRAEETIAEVRDQNLYDRIASLEPAEREALLKKLGELDAQPVVTPDVAEDETPPII